MSFLSVYTIISVILAISDIAIVSLTSRRKDGKARLLGMIGIFAAVVDISYLLSIYHFSYFLTSLFSSVYFLGIDAMLICLIAFILKNTDFYENAATRTFQKFIQLFFAFEILEFSINPFFEFSVSFDLESNSFIMGPLGNVHLAFAYIMVAIVFLIYVWQIIHVPAEYRMQYVIIIFSFLLVVGINALFLFVPVSVPMHIDYSICCYSMVIFALYWSNYVYREDDMLKGLSMTIFDNIDQGILLFDYNKKLLMANDRAKTLLAPISPGTIGSINDLVNRCGIYPKFNGPENSFSMQCFLHGKTDSPLRCDCRKISGRKGKVTGYLFVFTDLALSTDLLTEFHNWDSFVRLVSDNPKMFSVPSVVCMCDINSLTGINSTFGHDEGDKTIRELARNMRSYLPDNSYFVRGSDAKLIAVINYDKPEIISLCLQKATKEINHSVQYSVLSLENRHSSILEAIDEAEKAMKIRKLTDAESAHSQILSTLIRALEQTDPDTQSHVLRTRESGAELGRRLGLSDLQQAQLSLLCLLHDIGKIGVPLEILNKPSRLSDSEWQAMCSHVEKGYNITLSSPELSCIAEMVLHHHERWDGKGYPSRIKGEEIPLLSRIISVIDAYDAMVHDRCYRKALSIEQARHELERCSGTQFDPTIVSEFLKILDEKTFVEPSEEAVAEHTAVQPAPVNSALSRINNSHLVSYTRYFLDGDNYIISTDANFEKLTGYCADDVAMLHLRQSDLLPREDEEQYLRLTGEVLGKNGFGYFEHRIMRKDGSIIRVLCYGRDFFDSSVKEKRAEIIVTEIPDSIFQSPAADSASGSSIKPWKSIGKTDQLTGLLSHTAFGEEIELNAAEGSKRVLMLLLDIDNFNNFNAEHGLNEGDGFLVFTARILRGSLRASDLACRMGGDEFAAALFFDSHTPDSVLANRAQQIFDNISKNIDTGYKGCSISMGAAFTCSDVADFSALYREALHSLYVSKNSGRAQLTVAPGEMK